mgnify:CR=1 FL=1|jgi:hypothetical protein
MNDYLDNTHRDSVQAINTIRTWTREARQRIAQWEPKPYPTRAGRNEN